jgi:hypothetical protein
MRATVAVFVGAMDAAEDTHMTPDQQALLDAILEQERKYPIDPKNPPKVVRDLMRLIEQDVIDHIKAEMEKSQ